jgi:flagellar FliJ protein
MKRFQFRLQSVLALREEAEQKAERAYAEALQTERQALGKLQSAEAALATGEEIIRTRLREGPRAQELDHLRHYRQFLADQVTLAATNLAAAREGTESRRQALQKAMQEREALDRLRRRQVEAFNLEVARAEQKLLDEIGVRTVQSRSGADLAVQTL